MYIIFLFVFYLINKTFANEQHMSKRNCRYIQDTVKHCFTHTIAGCEVT